MIIAALFNSDHPKYNGFYGWPIRDIILGTNILQHSGLHIKVRVGDVLALSHSRTRQEFFDLCDRTYFWHPWNRLDDKKLRETYLKATVFAWVIQNIDANTAQALHDALKKEPSYLGMHGLDFSYPFHLALYRNSMIPIYRINGNSCNIFFSLSEDGKDYAELDELKQLHFQTVNWEDTGAHDTIFDDFDTLEHFEQVADFKASVSAHLPGGEDDAEKLALLLEDLNPKLFDVLGAAVRTLVRARNDEDVAQVGLSARRYLEQLADTLFPAQKESRNGREMTQKAYKNRIWAYIEDSISASSPTRDAEVKALGMEVDRLVSEANATLHGKPDKEGLIRAFGDLAQLTVALLQLNPESARKPYLPFNENIKNFLKQSIERHRYNDVSDA